MGDLQKTVGTNFKTTQIPRLRYDINILIPLPSCNHLSQLAGGSWQKATMSKQLTCDMVERKACRVD
jgi:hypothetical protein